MNFKELYEKALRRAGDDISDVEAFTINIVKDAINEGYQEVCTKYKPYIKENVTLIDKGFDLNFLTEEFSEIKDIKKGAEALSWTRENNTIIVDGDYLEVDVTYYYLPGELVEDDDDTILPINYQALLLHFGAYVYLKARKKVELSSFHYQRYLEGLSNVKRFVGVSNQSQFVNRW